VFEDLAFLCESKGFATGIDIDRLVAVRSILREAMPNEPLYGGMARATAAPMPAEAPAGNDSMLGASRAGESLTRWLFAHPKALEFLTKVGRRSGKAPRMPGVAGVQGFQREALAALTLR